MGWRVRKSIKLAPGVRLNVSRRGVGYSVGPRGLKVSRGADGKYRRTLSVPGTGLYNTSVIGPRKKRPPMPKPEQQSHLRWVAPPTWPQPPDGWAPPPGWQPDPAWGPAPAGWQFWQTADSAPPKRPAVAWARRHPKSTAAAAVLALLFAVGSVSGESDDRGPGRQEVVALAADTEAAQQAKDEAARKAVEQARAAEEAAAAKAAAETAARVEAERVAGEQAAAAAEAARVEAERAAEAARAEAEQRAAAEAAAQAEAERRAAQQAAASAAAPAKKSTASSGTAHGGAFCAPQGATGTSSAGNTLVCKPASDGRNRWQKP